MNELELHVKLNLCAVVKKKLIRSARYLHNADLIVKITLLEMTDCFSLYVIIKLQLLC